MRTKIKIDITKPGALKLFQDLKCELKNKGINFISENEFEYDETDIDIVKAIYDKYYQKLDYYKM